MTVLDDIVADQIRTDLPELASGDTVRVSAKVVEGNRERIQVFEGNVMRMRGGGITRSITVRALRSGVGVERTFKVNSPRIDKIEVVRHGVAGARSCTSCASAWARRPPCASAAPSPRRARASAVAPSSRMTSTSRSMSRLGRHPVHDGGPEADHAPMHRLAHVDATVLEHPRTQHPVEAVQRGRVEPVGAIAEAHDVEGRLGETLEVGRRIHLRCERAASAR